MLDTHTLTYWPKRHMLYRLSCLRQLIAFPQTVPLSLSVMAKKMFHLTVCVWLCCCWVIDRSSSDSVHTHTHTVTKSNFHHEFILYIYTPAAALIAAQSLRAVNSSSSLYKTTT